MPYIVRKGRGSRPWKIVRESDKQVIGSAMTQAQAYASVRARMNAEKTKLPRPK